MYQLFYIDPHLPGQILASFCSTLSLSLSLFRPVQVPGRATVATLLLASSEYQVERRVERSTQVPMVLVPPPTTEHEIFTYCTPTYSLYL